MKIDLTRVPLRATALVGVSGGRDSVALLDALVEAGARRLVVCHVDHRLRGAASTGDARFVVRLAGHYGLPCEVLRVDVAALAKQERLSIEGAARRARHQFFAEVARRYRCRRLLLGHHAEDQAETIFFNLLRGSGPAGIGGMLAEQALTIPPVAPRQRPVTLQVVRPLLGASREEIDAYVAARRLRFREDATNASSLYSRNACRHQLLPLASKLLGRQVAPSLLRFAEIMREEEAWLASLLPEREPERLAVEGLRAQPVAVQRRRLLNWLRGRGIAEVGFEVVERVRTLLHEPARAKVNLPEGRFARRRAGELFVV